MTAQKIDRAYRILKPFRVFSTNVVAEDESAIAEFSAGSRVAVYQSSDDERGVCSISSVHVNDLWHRVDYTDMVRLLETGVLGRIQEHATVG